MIEIPPYLIDAKRPEEVYNIDDSILYYLFQLPLWILRCFWSEKN